MKARTGLLLLAAVVAGLAGATSAPALRAAPPLAGVNFISVCGFSHRAPDDPILFPDYPNASHDHSFVGNTTTNATSTLGSLRAAASTCRRRGDTAAYWMPTLLAAGMPVPPTAAAVYYRRLTTAKLRAFPPGLKIVAGNSHSLAPQSILVTYWDCGDLVDVQRSSEIPNCPSGASLRLHVNFPDCWDAKSLDSLDHQRHMAYSRAGRCPRDHPAAVPAITVVYSYALPDGTDPREAVLASGGQHSGHADFINSWEQPALTRLVSNCLNRYRHCGTGS